MSQVLHVPVHSMKTHIHHVVYKWNTWEQDEIHITPEEEEKIQLFDLTIVSSSKDLNLRQR